MEIYLLRHGIAEEARPGGRDSERALTGDGKRRLRTVLSAANQAGFKPQVILSSPYRRAVETARIAAEICAYHGQIIESQAFTPMADVKQAWDELRLYGDARSVLVASHEPLTGLLIGYLCGAAGLSVDVKKGALARIDVGETGAQPRGVLKWMLTPKLAGATSD